MNIKLSEAMNTLPATTFQWLNMNDLHLSTMDRTPTLAYQKDYININQEELTKDKAMMIKTLKDPSAFTQIDLGTFIRDRLSSFNDIEYGVSKTLVKECESSNNAGLYLQLPEAITMNTPIRLEYWLDHENPIVFDHNIIYAKANSKATIVFDYSTDDEIEAFHNGLTKIIAEKGSHLTIIKIQRMNDYSHHFDSNYVYVDDHAKLNFIQVELGSKHSVTNYSSDLFEAGEASIDSVYFGDGDRLLDLSYLMKHIGRRSISNIQTKGALKDQSVKTFRGIIDFKKGAHKSKGCEEEYVTLFDKNIKSNAIPLLLCSEEDVEGQHAASAGKVDQEKLFYMMSRGFTKEEAMKLLVEASFHPIINKIPLQDLRLIVSEEIHRKLKTV